jgi:alpha-L-fucosidase 2
MKEAAQFYLANLVEYRSHLLPAPAISAEHQSSLGYLEPPFQDVEMVGDLFANVVEAAKVLDVDAEFRQRVAATRERMMPLKIGRLGQLQEWVADIDDPNCKHRHFMHLYAVHPGQQIDPLRMPELAAAARVSMNLRGDGENAQRFDPKYSRATWVCSCRHNGSPTDGSIGGNWSRAWKIWIWGRLFDGNRADKIFSQLIGEAGNENLTTYQQRGGANDTRAKPMQLDGSITTPGFMAEMLLQSQFGELRLLPALPNKWPSGSVTGLVARGGARVDVKWNQGKLASAVITLPKGAAAPAVRVAQQPVDPTQDRRIQLRWL